MENLLIFFVTVGVYFGLWEFFYRKRLTPKKTISALGIIAVLCAPFNINGNVWTVLGNASGKNVYSVFSVYQRADIDAITILGLCSCQKAGRDALTGYGLIGYQKAGRDALTLFGVIGHQKAGEDAKIGVGLSGYQKATRDALIFLGLSGYQRTGGESLTVFGATGYQRAEKGTKVVAAIAFYQKVGTKDRSFAVASSLN